MRCLRVLLTIGEILKAAQNGDRLNINCHPTTSGSSHLLKGVFLGYFRRAEVRKPWNSRRFLADCGSVPGANYLIISLYYMVFIRLTSTIAKSATISHFESTGRSRAVVLEVSFQDCFVYDSVSIPPIDSETNRCGRRLAVQTSGQATLMFGFPRV